MVVNFRSGRRALMRQGLTRRAALATLGAGLGVAFLGRKPVLASKPERRIALRNLHTGESLTETYWAEGRYQEASLERINRLLRDHRNDDVMAIDPSLIDSLEAIHAISDSTRAFEIISGYRSAATNKALQQNSEGVAENSYHLTGQAIDVRLPGLSLLSLRRAARGHHDGGVGYYPISEFLHLDSGPKRFW